MAVAALAPRDIGSSSNQHQQRQRQMQVAELEGKFTCKVAVHDAQEKTHSSASKDLRTRRK